MFQVALFCVVASAALLLCFRIPQVQGSATQAYLTITLYPNALSNTCNKNIRAGGPFSPLLGGPTPSDSACLIHEILLGGDDGDNRIKVYNLKFRESSSGRTQESLDTSTALFRRIDQYTRARQLKEVLLANEVAGLAKDDRDIDELESRLGTPFGQEGLFPSWLGQLAAGRLYFEKPVDGASFSLLQTVAEFGNTTWFNGPATCQRWPLALLQFQLPIHRYAPNEQYFISVEGVFTSWAFVGKPGTSLFGSFRELYSLDISYFRLQYYSTDLTFGHSPANFTNDLFFTSKWARNGTDLIPHCFDL